MAGGEAAAGEVGVGAGDGGEEEEGGFAVVVVEKVEQQVDVAFDAAGPMGPIGAGDGGVGGFDVEVFFDIDGDAADGGRRGGSGSGHR